ncbi:MAG: hypothetical protein PHD21_03665 [Flavobacteriales bacterium]|nr:hypothetical protein [Flavobacteriales bacterium]
MKSKITFFCCLFLAGILASCTFGKKDEAMKKAAMSITDDFTSGNIDGFISCLDTSVRSMYPADQVLAAYQAISLIMGGPQKTSSMVELSMMGENPVATVTVSYQGGKIAYQSGFDSKGNIIAFVPVPLDGEIVYQEEELVVVDTLMPDSTATVSSTKASSGSVSK